MEGIIKGVGDYLVAHVFLTHSWMVGDWQIQGEINSFCLQIICREKLKSHITTAYALPEF